MEQTKNYTCITGASAGIGAETARQFAKLGTNLIFNCSASRTTRKIEARDFEPLSGFRCCY